MISLKQKFSDLLTIIIKRKIFLFLTLFLILICFFFYKSYDISTDPLDILVNEHKLYKISSFKTFEMFNRKWIFPSYTDVEGAYIDSSTESSEIKFKNLINNLLLIKYNENAGKYLRYGANCQTLTLYIEDWCKKNNISYEIFIEPTHMYIAIQIENQNYIINFNRELKIYNEYTGESLL